MIVARLAGRCANGAERDGGRKYHLLERFSEFGTALCGAEPARTSGGWSEPYGKPEVTCARCLKVRDKIRTREAMFNLGVLPTELPDNQDGSV